MSNDGKTADETWKTTDYEWVIPRRQKSQQLLLGVYTYLQQTPNLENRPVARSIFGLLVGASYSLWRAAFLAMPERNWQGPKGILDGAKRLLDYVLENNAVGYFDEKRIEGWTVGYYLNNAYYRIGSALDRLKPAEDNPAFFHFRTQQQEGITRKSPQEIWDIGCGAAFAILDHLHRYSEPNSDPRT